MTIEDQRIFYRYAVRTDEGGNNEALLIQIRKNLVELIWQEQKVK